MYRLQRLKNMRESAQVTERSLILLKGRMESEE